MKMIKCLFLLVIAQHSLALKLPAQKEAPIEVNVINKAIKLSIKEYELKNPAYVSLNNYFCQIFTLPTHVAGYRFQLSECLLSLLHQKYHHIRQVDQELFQTYKQKGLESPEFGKEIRYRVKDLIQGSFNQGKFDSLSEKRLQIEELFGGYYLLKFDKCLRENTCSTEFAKDTNPTQKLWEKMDFQLSEFQFNKGDEGKASQFLNFIQHSCVMIDSGNVDSILEADKKLKMAIKSIASDLVGRMIETSNSENVNNHAKYFEYISEQARRFLNLLETDKLQNLYQMTFCTFLENERDKKEFAQTLKEDLKSLLTDQTGINFGGNILEAMNCAKFSARLGNFRILL